MGMTVSANRWDEMTHRCGIDLMIGNVKKFNNRDSDNVHNSLKQCVLKHLYEMAQRSLDVQEDLPFDALVPKDVRISNR